MGKNKNHKNVNHHAQSKEAHTEEIVEAKATIIEEVEEAAKEEAKEAEVTEAPIEALPKFKNNGKDIKINLGNHVESEWITVKSGEIVTIPRKIALANKLEEVN